MPETLRHVCGEIVHKDDQGRFHHRFDRDCELPSMTKCPLCGYELEDGWFRPLYKVDPMNRQMMEATISRNSSRACSNCWGYAFTVKDVYIEIEPLTEDEEPTTERMYYVLCVDCKEETQGYVTSGYIGFVRRKDYENYGNSILSLAPILEIETHQKMGKERSIESTLHELGF